MPIVNNKQEHMNITLQDIAGYRKQIDELEVLVKSRDFIADSIHARTNGLNSILDAVANLKSTTAKLKKSKAHESRIPESRRKAIVPTIQEGSTEERMLDVAARHPTGATLEDFTNEMNLSHHTVKRYLYSSQCGHLILDRDVNASGQTVWFAK